MRERDQAFHERDDARRAILAPRDDDCNQQAKENALIEDFDGAAACETPSSVPGNNPVVALGQETRHRQGGNILNDARDQAQPKQVWSNQVDTRLCHTHKRRQPHGQGQTGPPQIVVSKRMRPTSTMSLLGGSILGRSLDRRA